MWSPSRGFHARRMDLLTDASHDFPATPGGAVLEGNLDLAGLDIMRGETMSWTVGRPAGGVALTRRDWLAPEGYDD